MSLELSKEVIDTINKTVAAQARHFLRLSSERDVYSIPQASFRLNCSRNEFKSLFVNTGKIKLLLRDGKTFVDRNEIENYLAHEKKFTTPQAKFNQLNQTEIG